MKKETLAAVFLGVILLGCVVNIFCIGNLTDNIIALIQDAESVAENDNWKEASAKLNDAMAIWEKHRVYLSIILPNDTNDSITESFHELHMEIEAQDLGRVSWTARNMISQLEQTSSMEQVSIESIF
ncbi:MAG: DUF4363 family protein [Ruminococcaceae bacterium]|nr:DUF4363 family protein [Oscillospiraceae bacterium]